jgi:hypothetical protein
MERQAVRLTREELCEKMWSRPAISLAEKFGISGRGLARSAVVSRFPFLRAATGPNSRQESM